MEAVFGVGGICPPCKHRVSDGPVPATKPRKIPLATTRRRLRWKKFQTRQSTSRQMGQHLCKMTSKPTRYAFLVRRKVLQFGGAIFKPTRYALWVRQKVLQFSGYKVQT